MSEQENEGQGGDFQIDELALLKKRADMLGINYSNNIGLDTLKQKIAAKQNGDEIEAEGKPPSNMPDPDAVPNAPAKSLRQYVIEKGMKLVRLKIVNLDPKKKDLPGEILTVANEHLGTVSKYIPYGEVTENGYHVPYCLYKLMKARKFLNIRTYKDRQNDNQIKVEQRWANEFALEVLPPLTAEELAALAAAQTSGGNIG